MTKEKLRDGLLKLSYGISGELDEYQRQRLDHLGNSGYLLLTLFTPLLLVAMVLALTTTYKIAFFIRLYKHPNPVYRGYLVFLPRYGQGAGADQRTTDQGIKEDQKVGSQAGDYHRPGCGIGGSRRAGGGLPG